MTESTEQVTAEQWKKFYDAHAHDANFFEMPPDSWGYFKRSYRNYVIMQWLRAHGKTGGHFLDAGAGSGLSSMVAARNGFRPFSIDISEVKLRQLQVASRTERFASSIVLSDLNQIPAKDGHFDVINCQEVIEHIEDPVPIVREFHRVLRDDGIVVISTPYREKLKQHSCPKCGHSFHLAGHFHTFDENSIQHFFRDVGFELVDYFTIFLPGAWRARRLKAPYSMIAGFERLGERLGRRGTAAAYFFRKTKRS